MSKLISIASGKGGVGKSFCSSSLALSLSAAGYRTLLSDNSLICISVVKLNTLLTLVFTHGGF